MIKRNPKDYTSSLLTRRHQLITKLSQIKKYSYDDMYLFYKGVDIGCASLEIDNKKKKYVHSEGVSLDKKYRQKGHGIFLYIHLIDHAIRLGATRIYSSTNLNKFSRRMWKEKLPKLYKVKIQKTKSACSHCGSTHERDLRYYIDLK